MTFRDWGRGRQPHLGGPAHAEGGERGGGGEGAFLGDREPQRPARLPPPDRPSEPRSWPPSPCPAARGTPGGGPGPPQPLLLTCGHRCMSGAPSPRSRVGRGREGGPLLPPARALPSPGRLRSHRRRRCPLLQCESRRRRAGPGPGRPGNRDSTWRCAARRRAHPLSGPLPRRGPAGAAPPRIGGGWWLRRRGHPIRRPAARDSGCRRREGG